MLRNRISRSEVVSSDKALLQAICPFGVMIVGNEASMLTLKYQDEVLAHAVVFRDEVHIQYQDTENGKKLAEFISKKYPKKGDEPLWAVFLPFGDGWSRYPRMVWGFLTLDELMQEARTIKLPGDSYVASFAMSDVDGNVCISLTSQRINPDFSLAIDEGPKVFKTGNLVKRS